MAHAGGATRTAKSLHYFTTTNDSSCSNLHSRYPYARNQKVGMALSAAWTCRLLAEDPPECPFAAFVHALTGNTVIRLAEAH